MRGFSVSSFTYTPRGRGGAVGWFKGFDLLGRRWGVDISTVYVGKERYLDRWILYINGYTLRLHRFWRGDDDRASHTHPWWFITFPLTSYEERLYERGHFEYIRKVTACRFHYRPANHEHYVVGPWWLDQPQRPFWTLVLTGPKNSTWGFYPFRTDSSMLPPWFAGSADGKFINWRDYD